jgi:UDP-2,3-diacylglucosamine pyrophosphatase LpxH
MMEKRKLDVLILSDIHLGTRGCEAAALVNYLKTIEPKILVLNGDIMDIWQFRTGYFPKSHWAVIHELMNFAKKGIPVYYLTGNHDDALRKIAPFQMGNIYLENKLILELDGKLAWIFHGDVYDGSITHGRWAAKMGGKCYDAMIVLNRGVNRILQFFRLGKVNFSKRLKQAVKKTVSKVSNFETTAINIALEKGYDYVICGHIHRAQIREIKTDEAAVTYLNSGDWLESLTALEYVDGKWTLFEYAEDAFDQAAPICDLNISLDALLESVQDSTVQEELK